MTMAIRSALSEQAVRLKKIRLYLGMTREQFGEKIGISQYTIRSWENGAKNFTESSVKRVTNALNKKIKFSCSVDWMMYGTGNSPITLYEEKDKQQENEVIFDILQESLLKEVMTFKSLNKDASVIVVSDKSFIPLANPGDYIGLTPVRFDDLEKHLGSIIFFADGKDNNIFGILIKKSNAYHIVPLNKGNTVKIKKTKDGQLFLLVWFRKLI